MKQKILAKLKALHPGLPTAFLEFVAARLEPKVTEEAQIEGQIQAFEAIIPLSDQATFFTSEADRRVTEAKKKWDAEKEKPPTDNPPPPAPPTPGNDVPEWAKALIEQNKTLAADLSAMKTGSVANAHKAKMEALFKEKEVPESYYGMAVSGRTFKDDAEVDTFAAGIITNWGAFQQQQADKGLTNLPKPIIGKPSTDSEVSPMVKQVLDARKAATAEAVKTT